MKRLFLLLLIVNCLFAVYLYFNTQSNDISKKDYSDSEEIVVRGIYDEVIGLETVCLEWGPFNTKKLRMVRDDVLNLNMLNRLTVREMRVVLNWWVYIPPRRSREAMEVELSHLEELGIEDFFPITKTGKWRYSISLGLFHNETAARKYLNDLRKLGVDSIVLSRRKQTAKQSGLMIVDIKLQEQDILQPLL